MTTRNVPAELPRGDAAPARVQTLTRSLVRSSLVFGILALLLPSGCYALFERATRSLDRLAEHGQVTEARVTERRSGYTHYAYTIDGTTHSWSVADAEAPTTTVAEVFAILYLPEEPSFSRPRTDRVAIAREATENRSFARKLAAGLFWFFAANLLVCQVRLRQVRALGEAALDDPKAYRTTLFLPAVLILAPMLVLLTAWHANDAARRNEPIWPVVLGTGLVLGAASGAIVHLFRGGVANARSRALHFAKWAIPLAIGAAILRALAQIFTK